MRLIEVDRPLFSASLWRQLPSLLIALHESRRVLLCVVEETDPPSLRFLGGSAFLNPSLRDKLVAHPAGSVLAGAMTVQLERGIAFLNRRQVAEANRRGELILLNFFGTIEHLVGGGAGVHEALDKATTAWTFFHTGFNFQEVILETASESLAEMFRQLAARFVRDRPGVSGGRMFLYRLTREDAARNPVNWPFNVMVPAEPRFGFTQHQQAVLELALLDFSDREIMKELDLTEESLKKRWRSIYRAAERVEPALFVGKTHADLRRALLQRIRYNLVELRPYR